MGRDPRDSTHAVKESEGRAGREDFLTAEQREYQRLEQERKDAEYARLLAANEGAGNQVLLSTEPAYQALQSDGASGNSFRAQIPLMTTFGFCISLRCGALIIIGVDVFASVMQALASITVLLFPELALEAEDETIFVGRGLYARSERFLVREMRVRLFLASLTIYYAIRAWHAVQSMDAQVLREYLNWKVLDTAIVAVLGVSLHRLWWDGCGYLPSDSCWDLRWTYVTNTMFLVIPPIYGVWVLWSLFQVLSKGDGSALAYAGFVPLAQTADAAFGGEWLSPRLRSRGDPHLSDALAAAPVASPRTTYRV